MSPRHSEDTEFKVYNVDLLRWLVQGNKSDSLPPLSADGIHLIPPLDETVLPPDGWRPYERMRAHELDNLRAALAWSLDAGDGGLALRLATGLAWCLFNSDVDEGRRWDPAEIGPAVRELLAQAPAPAPVYGAG